jgi:hypothetical protein
MHTCARAVIAITSLAWSSFAAPAEALFTGRWGIDFRTPAERKQNVECGTATFALVQNGDQITGSHAMATAGCGRINEGGAGTVKGVVVGSTAVLLVTSGRNGAIAMGTARLRAGSLHWRTVDQVKEGDPEGDSPLILGQGVLRPIAK